MAGEEMPAKIPAGCLMLTMHPPPPPTPPGSPRCDLQRGSIWGEGGGGVNRALRTARDRLPPPQLAPLTTTDIAPVDPLSLIFCV